LSHQEQFDRIVTVVRRGVRGLYRTGITRMAAALAYRTIFSIIPVLAIGLLIFGSVVKPDQVEGGMRRVLEFAGISQISVAGASLEPDQEGPVVPVVDDPTTEVDESELVEATAQIEEIISDLVIRVNETLLNLPTGWIALITGLVLFYAAISMLVEVEKSFNQICGAPGGRHWARRLLIYWGILTGGGLVLVATFWTGDALAGFVRGSTGSPIRSALAGYGASVLMSTALLLMAYLVVPNVRLKIRPVLAGAFLAAVVWEMGKWGFTSYLRYSTNYARFYGSLALLPLFMLWVYVTWVIVLLGLQAAYTLQHFTRLIASSAGTDRDGPRLVDPASAVALSALLVRTHRAGQTPDASELAPSLGLDAAVVESLLRRLERAGLARRVVGTDDDTGWVPARPAERIGVVEVLDAVGDLDASKSIPGDAGVLRSMAQARRAAVQGKSMADAAPDTDPGSRPGPATPEPEPV
jgi:membrane protein